MQEQVLDDNNSWDYMLLVVRWAPTVCLTHSDCIYPSNATIVNIHGLWPNRNDGSWPSNCDNSYPFNFTQIAPIYSQLLEVWTSFYGGADSTIGFYEHEWEKHGTCAIQGGKGLRNEFDYFQAVYNLFKKLDAEGALRASGIVPSSSKKYPTLDIQSAIANNIGGNVPSVSCTNYQGNSYLNEIQICVDKSLQFMKCPSAPKTGCDSVMLLPAQ